MRATGTDIAVPVLGSDGPVAEEDIFDFSSGYVQRALNILPKQGDRMPWRLNQDYLFDRKVLREDRVDDGVLAFQKAHAVATEPAAIAAE